MSLLSRLPRLAEALAAAIVASAVVLVAPTAVVAHEYEVGELRIDHPWARASPGMATVAGGYFKVANRGDTDDRLVRVTAEGAGRAEIHEMAMADGVMTMRHVPGGLTVPAGGELVLKPGGFHVMFMDLQHPLKKGDKVSGTLTFEKAGTVVVEFAVEAIAASGEGHH